MAIVFPSLIAADLLNLEATIKKYNPECQGYHLDIMDFHFVKNLTWGPAFIEAISRITKRQLWVHLMVDTPQIWVDTLALPPDSILTFHIESIGENLHLIKHIQEKKWQASIAISPKTDVATIFPILSNLHQVLIMTVEPGWSGQSFLKESMSKIEQLVGYRQTSGLNFKIAVDGGINAENIGKLTEMGVDHFAVANAIFDNPYPVQALKNLQELAGDELAGI